MDGGRGFQFTPFGITALGDASGASAMPEGDVSPGFVAKNLKVPEAQPARVAPAQASPLREVVRSTADAFLALSTSPMTGPRAVVRAAKARAKQIRAELRRMASLQKELAELERLIAAAAKPVAAVRPIDSARRAR